MFTKNSERTGPGVLVAGTTAWNTVDSNASFKAAQYKVGVSSFAGFGEMVRFKFTVSNPNTEFSIPSTPHNIFVDANTIAWVRYRILMPTWFDTSAVA